MNIFSDKRRPYYDDFDDYEYERRPMRNRNRPESRNTNADERKRGGGGDRRRPAFEDEKRPAEDRRRTTERRPVAQFGNEERRLSDDRNEERSYSRRNPLADDRRKPLAERLAERQSTEESISDEKSVKPVGSIFDRARPPPKVIRPVPLSAKSKFSYKSDLKDRSKVEEYEEYEDEAPVSGSTTTTTLKTTTTATSTPKPFSFPKLRPPGALQTTAKPSTTAAAEIEYYDDEYDDTVTSTQKPIESSSIKAKDERTSQLFTSRTRNDNTASTTAPLATTTTLASSPESFRLNRYTSREQVHSTIDPTTTTKKPQPAINGNSNSKKYANKQTVFEPVTHETPPLEKASTQGYFQSLYNNRNLEKLDLEQLIAEEKEQKPAVRVVKRPFLPSRGGNPYKARGLQPVGVLAEQHGNVQSDDNESTAPGIDVRQASDSSRVKLEDLYNEEYDVDLNDALNPMLKPLTSSRNVNSFYGPETHGDGKPQSQNFLHKADHFALPEKSSSTVATTTSTTPQPEYYDDELEYTYADDVA
jgi:hypothetical protein